MTATGSTNFVWFDQTLQTPSCLVGGTLKSLESLKEYSQSSQSGDCWHYSQSDSRNDDSGSQNGDHHGAQSDHREGALDPTL